MEYKLNAHCIWELGSRENQEDSLFPKYGEIVDTDRLFILCDGMGGHSSGEIASETVCSTMSNYILLHDITHSSNFSDDEFETALNDAYDALDEKDNGEAKKMGTTLAFLKLHNAGCTIAHIGDSRVYHIRPGKNAADTEILFQTEDHSLVNDLVKIGELTLAEAKVSTQKHVITRAMQPNMERRSKADIYHSHDIQSGDYFMLCSDGILEQMEDDNIKFIFSTKGGDVLNKINILIKATRHNRDNHSAILVNIVDVYTSMPYTGISFDTGSTTDQLPEDTKTYGVHQKTVQKRCSNKKTDYHANSLLKVFLYCALLLYVVVGVFCLFGIINSKNKRIKSRKVQNVTKRHILSIRNSELCYSCCYGDILYRDRYNSERVGYRY